MMLPITVRAFVLLGLSFMMSACLIIEVEVSEQVEANGTVTIRIVVQEEFAYFNARKGVQVLLVPNDWSFVSGEYSASDVNGAVGSGSLLPAPNWADSAVIGAGPPPPGWKYIGLVSDAAYTHGDTLIVESTVSLSAGDMTGTFPIGVIVTKEDFYPSFGDWFGPNIVGADSSMMHYVTVNEGPVCEMQSEIPQVECEALAELYNSTGGDSWTDNSGWLAGSPCSWYGVICSGGHVQQLSLSNSGLAGPIPASVGDLSSLTWIDLSSNALTGSIPASFGNLVSCTGIHLSGNGLTGSIPSSLANLSGLGWLDLSNNGLTGSIPESIGNISNLAFLFLNRNGLTGSIPSSLGSLTGLLELGLGDNDLTGSIPASLGNLINAQYFDLNRNRLSGSIPSSLGNLSNVTTLLLMDNELTGPIPASLGNLVNLDFFHLEQNNLEATVPLAVAAAGSDATQCDLTGNAPSLCMPDIPAYQALGDPVCGLGLDADCPPILELLSPAAGAAGLTTSPTLTWTDLGAGIRYDLQVGADADFGSIVYAVNVPQAHSVFVSPVAGRTYFWRVRAVFGGRTYDWVGPRQFGVGVTGPLAVSLLAPANKSTNQTKVLDFSWTSVSGANAYHFQLSEREDFATAVVDEAALSGTSYRAVGLRGGTTYFWRVAGVDGLGRKTFSQPRSFTTVVDAPGAIALTSPEDDAENVPRVTSFVWMAHADAGTYQLHLASDASFANIVISDSANTKTSFTPAMPLEYGAVYYWRVRGRNAGGNGAWSETRSFTTIVAAPEAVTLIHPADSAMGISVTPVFAWDALASALTYQLHVSVDTSFTTLVLNDSALATTADTVDVPLGHDTRHYWRVRARNAGGDGAWSDVRSFTTIIAAPEAVSLVSPDAGAQGVAAFTMFSWQPLDGAAAYHLQLSSDASFTAPVVDDSALTDPTFAVSEPLAYSATYYWRVRAALDDGLGEATGLIFGPWSETRSFTVAVGTAAEGESDLPSTFALHPNYPNPFNPSTTIRYDVPEQALVKIAVYDALGRLVEILSTKYQVAGTYAATWDAAGRPTGVYFVRMEAGEYRSVKRMTLMR